MIRNRLKNNPAFDRDNIDELEGHLREETEKLAQEGLTLEEAFMEAAHRLGPISELSREYRKNRPGWESRVRMTEALIWFLLTFLVGLMIGQLSVRLDQVTDFLVYAMSVPEIGFSLVLLLGVSGGYLALALGGARPFQGNVENLRAGSPEIKRNIIRDSFLLLAGLVFVVVIHLVTLRVIEDTNIKAELPWRVYWIPYSKFLFLDLPWLPVLPALFVVLGVGFRTVFWKRLKVE